MNYLLDTNIIIIYSRNNDVSKLIEHKYRLFEDHHNLFISAVSLGEIDAIIKKLNLGKQRRNKIYEIIAEVGEIGIHFKEIIEKYGDIDAFSQGKLKHHKGKFSSRNMGKNDIWIAATASAFEMILVTTDKGFDHLDQKYIKLEYIDLEKYLKKQ